MGSAHGGRRMESEDHSGTGGGWRKRWATLKMTIVMGEGTVLLTGMCLIALCAFDARAQEGDATAGAAVFKRCAICHVVDSDKNKVGPSLRGLFGKNAGTHPGFAYSAAMKAAGEDGLVWGETTLRGYLHNPKTNLVGTKMAFPGLKDDQAITDLISYLKQHSE